MRPKNNSSDPASMLLKKVKGGSHPDYTLVSSNQVSPLYKLAKEYKEKYPKRSVHSEILISEQPFDLQGLATELQERLNLLEADVKLFEDARMIQVLNKVKVTEKGVEGTGPVADRVRVVFEQFMESLAEEEEKEE